MISNSPSKKAYNDLTFDSMLRQTAHVYAASHSADSLRELWQRCQVGTEAGTLFELHKHDVSHVNWNEVADEINRNSLI